MAERADLVFHNKAIDGTAIKRLIRGFKFKFVWFRRWGQREQALTVVGVIRRLCPSLLSVRRALKGKPNKHYTILAWHVH